MPRNSSGLYSLPSSYFVQSGDAVLPVQHNPPFEDIAQALTGSLPRNGSAGMTADLPMGAFKVTGMANATADGDAVTLQQFRQIAVTPFQYGAIGDGIADDSAAFIAAQAASAAVFVPKATYNIDNKVPFLTNRVWLFDGPTFVHTDDTETMFEAANISGLTLLGDFLCQGLLTSAVSTGECALRIINPNNIYIQSMTALLFKGTGLEVSGTSPGTYRGDSLVIDTLRVRENFLGFDFQAGSGAEYANIGDLQATGNVTAGKVAAGNTRVNGGNVIDNTNGINLVSGSNHGHGGFMGVNISHNTTWNLKVDTVTNGFTFDGCHFYGDSAAAGKIIFNSSQGVQIQNGIVDAVVENNGGTGFNTLRDNFIAGAVADISGSRPGGVVVSGNIDSGGLWSKNKPSPVYVDVSRITTNQSIPSITLTAVILNGENEDVGGNYNNTTGVFTAPVSGYYEFSPGVYITGTGMSAGYMELRRNGVGSEYVPLPLVSAAAVAVGKATVKWAMVAGDTFSFAVFLTGTSMVLNTALSRMTIMQLGG